MSQAERQNAGSDEPDVLLDVPVLKVEEIDLEVEGLRAHDTRHPPPYGRMGGSMSVRGQERRVREVMRRSDEVAIRSERRIQGAARGTSEIVLFRQEGLIIESPREER
jgi:hypothetical protein